MPGQTQWTNALSPADRHSASTTSGVLYRNVGAADVIRSDDLMQPNLEEYYRVGRPVEVDPNAMSGEDIVGTGIVNFNMAGGYSDYIFDPTLFGFVEGDEIVFHIGEDCYNDEAIVTATLASLSSDDGDGSSGFDNVTDTDETENSNTASTQSTEGSDDEKEIDLDKATPRIFFDEQCAKFVRVSIYGDNFEDKNMSVRLGGVKALRVTEKHDGKVVAIFDMIDILTAVHKKGEELSLKVKNEDEDYERYDDKLDMSDLKYLKKSKYRKVVNREDVEKAFGCYTSQRASNQGWVDRTVIHANDFDDTRYDSTTKK
jgi:hypothetical protein